MPDWSYRTVFRPLLFRPPFGLARDLCLGFMGGLARLPLGSAVIDFLGHMRPDERLRTPACGLELASPVILGPWLDGRLAATPALARFGFGAITIGPVAAKASGDWRRIDRDDQTESLRLADPLPTTAVETVAAGLARAKPTAPVIVRLQAVCGQPATAYSAQCASSCTRLAAHADAVALAAGDAAVSRWSPREWQAHVESLVRAAEGPRGPLPVLVCVRADADELERLLASTAVAAGARGCIVDGLIRASRDGDWLVGGASLRASLATVQRLRREMGTDVPIIAGGAVDPQSALELLAAGANAVQIDAALAYAGPGLPKRINDAVLFARGRGGEPEQPAADHAPSMSWFWALALGVAMLLGGLMALSFAARGVLLPYDESYLGMSAQELSAKIPRLLDFMAHDRVTLAGTMLAVGIQYVLLAWFGIRRGWRWAKRTVVVSAFAGFLSFFLFLGFGYFDPLHAFVTAVLFQFLLLALQAKLGPSRAAPLPNLRSDWRWTLANWGQLLLVVQGAAIVTAGVTISKVGITSVFVPEDLEFLGTTAEAIGAANPRLVPVVAHDRASFGGMLISVGVATLLPALWGIRQGESWLWWMLALAGTIGYGATLAVHLHVGYTSPMHLAPAVGGLALLWLALALLYPYLVARCIDHEATWKELLDRLAVSDAMQVPSGAGR